MSKDTLNWFKHDSDAFSDPKITALVAKYGMAGYGQWWRIIELLRREANYKYCISSKFSYPSLAKELMMSVADTRAFIEDCINEFELLKTDEETIWSDSLLRRMGNWDAKRAKLSENGRLGAEATNRKRNKKDKKDDKTPPAEGKPEPDYSKYKPEQVESFERFKKWIIENAPAVSKMKKPFTIDEYLKIVKKLSADKIQDLLKRMDNRVDLLKKYNSAYSTLDSWSRMSWNNDTHTNQNDLSEEELKQRAEAEARTRKLAKD